MVLANCRVAEEMVRLSDTTTPIIIRSQQVSTYTECMNIPNTDNKETISTYLNEHMKLHMKSAELRYYNPTTSKSNKHASLNLDLYTHFTSPIRRYSDILVHRTMYNLVYEQTFTMNCLKDDKSKIVDVHSIFLMNHYKRFYRMVSQLEKEICIVRYIVDTLKLDLVNRVIHLRGVVLDISSKNLRIKCTSIETDNLELGKLSEYVVGCIHTVTNTNNGSFDLFQKLDYKMCFLVRDVRKIRTYL